MMAIQKSSEKELILVLQEVLENPTPPRPPPQLIRIEHYIHSRNVPLKTIQQFSSSATKIDFISSLHRSGCKMRYPRTLILT